MNYSAAIRFPLQGPRPWGNIALIALCNLIPIVGPLVCMGYGALVEKALIRDPAGEIPRFDFAFFSRYLERGVAPFVVSLIVASAAIPVIGVAALFFVAMAALAHESNELMAAVIPLVVLLEIFFFVAVQMVLVPFLLRASLLGRVGAAFDFRWCLDFMKRTAGAIIISGIVMPLIAIPVLLAGECALCVGVYFSVAIIYLMRWHIQAQLYSLYLDRGGFPLAIPDEPFPPAFPVVIPPAPVAPKWPGA